jgi:hypothetical protein
MGGDEHQPEQIAVDLLVVQDGGKVCLTLVLAGFQLAAAVTGWRNDIKGASPWRWRAPVSRCPAATAPIMTGSP